MKYKVTLTRGASESTEVEVDADNPDAANEAAMEKAGKYGENVDGWTLDDNMHEVYLPDPGSTTEVE